jgi:hypothetical protein
LRFFCFRLVPWNIWRTNSLQCHQKGSIVSVFRMLHNLLAYMHSCWKELSVSSSSLLESFCRTTSCMRATSDTHPLLPC